MKNYIINSVRLYFTTAVIPAIIKLLKYAGKFFPIIFLFSLGQDDPLSQAIYILSHPFIFWMYKDPGIGIICKEDHSIIKNFLGKNG